MTARLQRVAPAASSVTLTGGEHAWNDPLLCDDLLTLREREIRDRAREYAQQQLVPRIRGWSRAECFDPVVMREMGELGYLGAPLAGYGCAALSYLAYGLVMRELQRVDTAFRSACAVQTSLCMAPIHAYGSQAQRAKYLPRMARGELIGCFGLTQPDHGSDPRRMTTRAHKTEGGWILSGTKLWVTHAPIADLMIVWAKDDTSVIRGFILERGMSGLSTKTIEGKFSMRASPTGEIVMDRVFVPDENLLPGVQGLKGPLGCLNDVRFGICWGALGAAECCWHTARQHVLDDAVGGRRLAAGHRVHRKLADMQAEIGLGLLACVQLSRLREQRSATPEMVSLLSRNLTGKALEIARSARDMLGCAGFTDAYPVMRQMLNLEILSTLEGTRDMHALIPGRAQTSISAF